MKLNLTLYRNEIVPVYTTDLGNQVVLGSELYKFLEIKEKYSDWAKRLIKQHRFSEANKDFTYFSEKTEKINPKTGKPETRGRGKIEYIFRLPAAKKIAMGTNNNKGDQVKDYFLACEKVAQAKPNFSNIGDHTIKQVQIENSKAAGALTFQQGGLEDTKEYYKKTCLMASGMTTSQVKSVAKAQGYKTKDTNSARAALRKINPPAAATISFIDTAYRSGVALDKVKPLADKVKDVFKDMLQLGIIPGELAA